MSISICDHSCTISGYLLYECGSFKVLNGLFKILLLKVAIPKPCNHIDVRGEVPEGLGSIRQHQSQS